VRREAKTRKGESPLIAYIRTHKHTNTQTHTRAGEGRGVYISDVELSCEANKRVYKTQECEECAAPKTKKEKRGKGKQLLRQVLRTALNNEKKGKEGGVSSFDEN
jgi:hypothetical protein